MRLFSVDGDPAKSRFGDLTVEATAAIIGEPDQARDDFRWLYAAARQLARAA